VKLFASAASELPAGRLAHDFNNVLTKILLFADLLRVGLPKGSPQSRHLDEIQAAVKQGDELIRRWFSPGGSP